MSNEPSAEPMPRDEEGVGSPVIASLRRYWWVLVVGGAVGLVAAVSMVYTIPGFEPRDGRTFTAQSRLFVTSPEGQYVRVSVPREMETGVSDGQGGSGGGPTVTQVPPNVQPLLAATNVYPSIIVSDEVTRLRTKMFGPLPGTVRANAFSAVSTPQRFAPAQIPIIDIFATSASPKQAITLANATSDAFVRWIKAEQNRSRVKPSERILIRELQVPQVAIASPGPSWGVPMLVALALVAAFGFLAVVLDRLSSRPGEAGGPTEAAPAPETPRPAARWS